MKIRGIKFIVGILAVGIIFAILDIVLMKIYGFEKESYIRMYTLISVVPVSSIAVILLNLSIPTVTFDNSIRKVTFDWIANENYKHDRRFENQGAIICFDEIVSCNLVDKKLIISIKDSRAKTLYLNAFSKKQRNIIHGEINKIINGVQDTTS